MVSLGTRKQASTPQGQKQWLGLFISKSVVDLSQDQGSYLKLLGKDFLMQQLIIDFIYLMTRQMGNSIDIGGQEYFLLGHCLEIIFHFQNSSTSSLSFFKGIRKLQFKIWKQLVQYWTIQFYFLYCWCFQRSSSFLFYYFSNSLI